MQPPYNSRPDHKNLIIAIVLSVGIMLAWQLAYEAPRQRAELARQQANSLQQNSQQVAVNALGQPVDPAAPAILPTREALLAGGGRVRIDSESLHGSIALKGARIDDLTLGRYRTAIEPDSPEVVLLSPAGNEHAYFVELGWLSPDGSARTPTAEAIWQADGETLSPGRPLILRWDNGQGQLFEITYTLDERYMFRVRQQVHNRGNAAVNVVPYGYINRAYPAVKEGTLIMHEGPIGALGGTLQEIHYEELREETKRNYADTKGWLGITDKYWLTALIPSQDTPFTANFSHYRSRGHDRYQAEYLGRGVNVPAGGSANSESHLFAGAKEVNVLDAYSESLHIPLFDRAVDFGYLYFLTKPIFKMLNFFYEHLGNFGLAILLLTVVIRGAMFPIANKSYASMAQIRRIQPEMMKIRDQYGSDKLKMNEKIVELYKKEQVNPMSGCLPMLIQLPVFFALYKVLFVTIEMRHAPFYGWIRDLSAPDPTSVLTLFGLIPWTPPAVLHIGILPILMSLTMMAQMQLNPAPTDPVQAKVMKLLPIIFLFLFASFPAGLVLYWTWSNILSIGQQYIITRKHAPS